MTKGLFWKRKQQTCAWSTTQKKAREAFDVQQMTIMRTYDDAAQKIQSDAVKLGPAALPVQPACAYPMQPLMVAPPMAPMSQMAMQR